MHIYVSGPLQGARDLSAARSFYEELGRLIQASGHTPYIPHHNTDPQEARHLSPEDVFERDLQALDEADAVIAHIGMPSTGVGAELAIAAAKCRPILGLKRSAEPSSRFAEGLILRSGGTVSAFSSHGDLADSVEAWLSNMVEDRPLPRRSGHPAHAMAG